MEITNEDSIVRHVLKNDDILLPETLSLIHSISNSIDCPSIQSYPKAIELYLASPLNPTSYVEAKGFEMAFDHEFVAVGKMENLIAIGTDFISYLYTYRSLSKALPEINIDIGDSLSADEKIELIAKRNDINRKVFDIMKPTIIKLKELISFVTTATTQIYDAILHLISLEQKKSSVPDDYYDNLIMLFDVIIKIDNLKDMKPSVQNDFSRYKRALGGQFTGEIMEELTRLQNFLTSPQDPRFAKNYIFLKLRAEVKNITGHEEILFDILSFANQKYESGLYIGSDSLFCILRVIPYLIVLIDGNASDPKSMNIFKTYKSKLTPYQQLARKYPYVPLYGDMTIGIFYVIQRAEHFDFSTMATAWTYTAEDVKLVGYDILPIWENMKKLHMEYTHRLSFLLLQAVQSQPSLFQKSLEEKHINIATDVYNITHEGIKLLSSYHINLKFFFAWKYSHPATENDLIELDVSEEAQQASGFEYAKAIRYNLSKEEMYILSEVIAMMKSLANMMLSAESSLAPILRYHMHHMIQHVIQIEMLPLLHRADKKNKLSMMSELLHIRTVAADWIYGVEPREDYKAVPSTSTAKSTMMTNKKIPCRVVSSSPTQLKILRSLIHMLYDEQSSTRRKEGMFFSRSELRTEDIQMFTSFYQESYYYPYLLNLSGTVRDVSDIGDLWYREFYLELAKCVQFPIDTSIPWMMIEYMIQRQAVEDIPIIENIFYVLDIYNDAAYRGLYVLQQQHLYDEVEAETNLVFDQLVFLIAEEVYSYYKNLVAASYLDRPYRYKLEELKNLSSSSSSSGKSSYTQHHLSVSYKRYDITTLQTSINLLGRFIDFNFLISQHIHNKLYRDLDIAIRRFEAYDLTGIVELGTILTILRHTHDMLVHHNHFALDDFNSMLHETNESFSPTTYKSRISFQILRSLVLDIYPNFSYNLYTQRFVRSQIILRPVEYSKSPKQSITTQLFGSQCYKAYEHWLRLSRGYIGRIHYEYLTSILLYTDLFMIIDESLKNINEKLQELGGYVTALHGGIPPINYPKYQFLSAGSFGYFEGKLKPILEYDDLKPEVYQGFREIGNTIALMKDLSDVLDIRSGFEFINLAPFVGVAPDTTMNTLSKPSLTPMGRILTSYKPSSSSSRNNQEDEKAMLTSGIRDQLPQAAELLITSISSNLIERKSLFHGALSKIEDSFYYLSLFNSWGCNPSPSICLDINASQAFHKLWSALIFLYCLPQKQSNAEIPLGEERVISDEEEFGHGFAMAGCLIMHMLDQRSAFELMDFSNHVLKVYESELVKKASMRDNYTPAVKLQESLIEDTEDFISAVVTLKKLQDEMFALFEAQHLRKSSGKKTNKKQLVLHPNDDD